VENEPNTEAIINVVTRHQTKQSKNIINNNSVNEPDEPPSLQQTHNKKEDLSEYEKFLYHTQNTAIENKNVSISSKLISQKMFLSI
jgi:hypothetical protein